MTADELKMRFGELADQWRNDTCHYSSVGRAMQHRAVAEIMAMGRAVLPLLFDRIERCDHFFIPIVHRMLRDGPAIPVEDRGRVVAMCGYWLRWGREQGYAAATRGTEEDR